MSYHLSPTLIICWNTTKMCLEVNKEKNYISACALKEDYFDVTDETSLYLIFLPSLCHFF